MRRLLLVLLLAAPVAAQTDAQLLDAARAFPPMPRESADLLAGGFVPPSLFTFASGTPYNDLEYTLFDTAYIEGETHGFDTFFPADPSDALPGTGRVHLVRGVNNLDLDAAYGGDAGSRIVLGVDAIAEPFFRRGPDGRDNDYVVVQNVDHRTAFLQLRGTPADYRVLYATAADGVATEGHYLFYVGGGDIDLVAFVWPCNVVGLPLSGTPPQDPARLCNASRRLSLADGASVRYARPVPATPAVPAARAQLGSPGNEIVGGVATDAAGRAYVLGATDGSLAGGPPAENRAFVAQVLPDGSRGWTFELPLADGSLFFDAAADDAYLYVAGRTLGALPGATNAGRWDAILLKLDLATGALVAWDQYGTAALEGYGNVVLDGAGALYVSGAGSSSGAASTDPDYLVAKHRTSTLANVWRVLEPPAHSGPVFVAEAWGGLSFAPARGGRPARLLAGGWFMSAGGSAGFLSLYDGLDGAAPRRAATATLNASGQRADWVLDTAIGPDDRIYAAGFTTGALGGPALGGGDAWVASFAPDLSAPTVRQVGTPRADLFRKLELGADGTLYGIGTTYGSAAAPNADPDARTGDVWVQAFSPGLVPGAAAQFGTAGEDRGWGALAGGRLVVGGMTEGSLAAPTAGAFDAFVAELRASDLTFAAPTASAPAPAADAGWRLAPQPASGTLQLLGPPVARVEVIDALGRVIARATGSAVDVSALAPGVYAVRVRAADGTDHVLRAVVAR